MEMENVEGQARSMCVYALVCVCVQNPHPVYSLLRFDFIRMTVLSEFEHSIEKKLMGLGR